MVSTASVVAMPVIASILHEIAIIMQSRLPSVVPVQPAHLDFEAFSKASMSHSILVQSFLGHMQTLSLL